MGLFTPKLSTKHLCRLTFHLWSLYRAGTPLPRAFELMDDEAFGLPLRRVGREMAGRLRQGETLAEALAGMERHFPPLARNLISVGEASGGLERMLYHLRLHYERRLALQRKALQVMLYPILLIVSFYLIEFVKGAVLTNDPLDVYVARYGKIMAWYWGTRLAVIVMAARILEQWGYLTRIIDFVGAKMWPIRSVFAPLAIARFFRSLRLMLDSGVHVVTALDFAIRGTSNEFIERQLRTAVPAVKEGTPILEAVAARGALPTLVRDMLVTGEYAGKSEENLEAAAEYLEAEATTTIRLFGAGMGVLFVTVILLQIVQGAVMMGAAGIHVFERYVAGRLGL